MQLILRNSSPQPIYEQLYDQIKAQILSSEMQAGEALPSLRALARDLRISVITTKRAYDDLERDGFIHTVPGKGCFVAEKNLELVREAHLREIESLLQKALDLSQLSGLSIEELTDLLQVLAKE